MLRYRLAVFRRRARAAGRRTTSSTVRTRNHTAASQLHGPRRPHRADAGVPRGRARRDVRRGDRAWSAAPRAPRFADETEVRLVAPAARGPFDRPHRERRHARCERRRRRAALAPARRGRAKDFAGLATDNAAWWHDFWARGSVALHSADGTADYVAAELPLLPLPDGRHAPAGNFPPKFNGMLWNTGGDLRTWGAQHWFANLSCYYEALFADEPARAARSGVRHVFRNVRGRARRRAAAVGQRGHLHSRDRRGSTASRRCPTTSPPRCASSTCCASRGSSAPRVSSSSPQTKLRTRAAGTGAAAAAGWRDAWVPTERGFGPLRPGHAHPRHDRESRLSLSGGATSTRWIASGCASRAYPMLKGAAEFYRHFPNLKKGDGRQVPHPSRQQQRERAGRARHRRGSLRDARHLRRRRSAPPRSSDVDAPRRAHGASALDNLAPLPDERPIPTRCGPADYTGPRVFVRGRRRSCNGRGFTPDGNSLPHVFFDLCNLDSPDTALLAIANATFDRSLCAAASRRDHARRRALEDGHRRRHARAASTPRAS